MTNIDKLLNFLDEHDALHNFFAENVRYMGEVFLLGNVSAQKHIYWAFDWGDSIDGYDYWKNLYDKAGEL